MKQIKEIIKGDSDFLFFLLILTTIVYITSWGGNFISDDIAGIVNNSALADFTVQLKTLSVTNILFSITYNLFGSTPFWYHILNTAFHLATVMVAYVLAALLASIKEPDSNPSFNFWIPRLTALIFALHPIESEGVTWISGFPYAAYTLFSLVGLVTFVLADKKSDVKKSLVLACFSAIFYALALRSSEKAIVLPVILFVYLIFFSRLSWKKIKLTLPILGLLFLYGLTLVSQFTQRVVDVAPSYSGGPTIYNPLVQIPIAIYSYVKLLFFPVGLTLYHEFVAFPEWEYWLAVGVTVLLFLVLGIVTWRGIRGQNESVKLGALGLWLFVISLVPTLLPVNIGWVVAERYVHFGSIGFFLASSAFSYAFMKRLTFHKVVVGRYLLVGTAVVLGMLTVGRNLEWRSQDTLWPATVRESPYSAYAWNNMGDYYGRKNDIENSIRAFETARRLRPRYADATHNLANAYLKINEATKAAQLYREALEYNPTLYQSYQQLGLVMMNQGQYAEAEKYFLQSAKLNPDPFLDHLYIYMNYAKSSNQEKAQEALLSARKLTNNNPQRLQLIQQIISEFETR